MNELVFWFMVGQSLTSLPQMVPGTEVLLVSRDLLTVYASARVEDGRLQFSSPIPAGQELRLLLFPPGAGDRERAQALAGAQALPGRVSDDGQDIEVELPDLDAPLSWRRWLVEERGIVLVVPAAEPNRGAP